MNVYEIITQKVIEQLENGVIPWRKPWLSLASDLSALAFNRITKKPYSFLNQLLLGMPGEWASFNQWAKLGGSVRKGEKGSVCVFFKLLPYNSKELSDDERENENKIPSLKCIPVLRYYTVFHISQVDGVQPLDLEHETELLKDFSPVENVDNAVRDFLEREHISISYGGNSAYYSPELDSIRLPVRKAFNGNAPEYYSTLLHECGHATGAKNRLNRFNENSEQNYAREELVAEIFAAAMLNTFGIETPNTLQNSVAYLQSWLSHLKNDKKLIVVACQRAEKAARFFLGETLPNEQPTLQAA